MWLGIRWISTIRRPASIAQTPIIAPTSSRVFDPDDWKCVPDAFVASESWTSSAPTASSPSCGSANLTSSGESYEDVTSSDEKTGKDEKEQQKAKKDEIVEENRADGHAPIKSALSILMHSLQKTSSMTTSLSDIDVTLFNFHSTKFAERLLNRNVSSIVIVESSHVFSKSAKKFAEKLSNVDAYRADIYTLMGVGRKKTAQFPRKMMFAGFSSKKAEKLANFDNIRSLTLGPSESEDVEVKVRRPHLLGVLPTANIQRTIVESMIQHAILHHSGLDADTVFRYGATSLLTFLSCGTLAQYTCSTDGRLQFLSHQHRRHSALFDKLFSIRMLNEPVTGYPPTSFHPQLPTTKRVAHVKKLAELQLIDGLQYAVQISPKSRVSIDGNEVLSGDGSGRKLVGLGCFLTQIGRQPNAKSVKDVVRALWPESSISIPADLLSDDKVGTVPMEHLEAIFSHVLEELRSSPMAKSYVSDLKIKRIV